MNLYSRNVITKIKTKLKPSSRNLVMEIAYKIIKDINGLI